MKLKNIRSHRGEINTPLRYPGGKTRLYGLLRGTIEECGFRDCTYVEPYAGGAGAAVSLLLNGDVKRLVINDLDPAIHAFWYSILRHPRLFVQRIESTPVTLEEWGRQRDIYREKDVSRPLDLGFATFFLNRTNRSGVMNAGVIGGRSQQGRYRIDARFNRVELVERVRRIQGKKRSIEITNLDGADLLRDRLNEDDHFFYIDPPYYDKGSFLYLNSFDDAQHASLAGLLREHRMRAWLVTYDDVEEIRDLYKGFYQGTFKLQYSAHRSDVAEERLIASSLVAIKTSLFA
jgi:DNA adenine methylase